MNAHRRLSVLVASACIAATGIHGAKAKLDPGTANARQAIRAVFGPYADQALRVAYCESHYSIWARNGQYLGMFQMGSSERARYGHGTNAWAQARAAYRYFVASGRDWSPWACRP